MLIVDADEGTYPALAWFDDAIVVAALSAASCCCPSVVMIGFNSFFRFLFAFPLPAFATCLALLIAACLICEPFMISTRNLAGGPCW